jgi:hypothetical protein
VTVEPRLLVAGYATDSLAEAEQRTLLRAALDDQELFDSLVEADGLREMLDDPAARQQLLAALDRPTLGERLRDWFERPATLLDLAAIAVLALAALAGFALLALPQARLAHTPADSRPLGAPLAVPQIAWLLSLPERQVLPAALTRAGFEGQRVQPGTALHLEVRVQAPARVALLDEPAAGAATQVWPGLGLPPALVSAPEGGGQATLALAFDVSAGGSHRLRLVVAPPDLDLGALSAAMLPDVAARLTLVDLRYGVAGP